MSEVRGPLAEVRQDSRLDGLDALGLLGVVGDPVFRAVGVRHKQRPFTVVAAAGARRHRRRLLAFFLPRRNASRRRLVQASAAIGAFAGVLTIGGELFRGLAAEITQSWALLS